VILAGHGERELIEAFAIDDPDDDVRAAACRYLAAIASKDDDAATAFLAERLASDRAPTVRAEVLRLVKDGRLDVPLALIESHASDEDLQVRTLVTDVLLRNASQADSLPFVLRSRALHEPENELRATIAEAWIVGGGAAALLDALRLDDSVDQQRAQELLGRIDEAGARFGWPLLRTFAGRNAATDRLIGHLLSLPLEPEALSWLLDIAARPLDGMPASVDRDSSQYVGAIYHAAHEAWERLAEVLPATNPESLSSKDRVQLARLTDHLANQLDDERAMALEDGGIDLDSLPENEQPQSYQSDLALLRVMRRIVDDAGT
jgi:hypothetical protein